jgi:AAA15 family ATPase/GTPase
VLKKFKLANFSSFDAEQTFDMTAGSTRILNNHVVDFGNVRILKTGVIYGANASGKSNLIKAIDFARKIIVNGIDSVDTYKKHFRLSDFNSKEETKFEFEIQLDGKFYSYSFSTILTSGQIVEEWLYEIGLNSPRKIFERVGSNISLGKVLQSGELKGRFEIYVDDMKNQKSQLFLSEIADKELRLSEVKELNSVFDWFSDKLNIFYPDDKYCGFKTVTNGLIKELTNYLSKFDTGVTEICTVEEDFEEALKNYPDSLKARIIKDSSNDDAFEAAIHGDSELLTLYKNTDDEIKVKKLAFIHGGKHKEAFELKEESDGTRRLLDFIPLLSKFSENHTILVDEFDRSLHPKLTKEFFSLFHALQDSKSQLIVSTHESTLMDLDILRRDEIWFVEKARDHSSKLFSLNSFKERYDKKVEKAYLVGRYGAVPVFKNFQNISWDE